LCHEENNSDIFLSQTQLRRLTQSLIVVSKFEDKSKAIVASRGDSSSDLDFIFEAEDCYVRSEAEKHFLYLRSAGLVRQVESLCRTVGASSGLHIVTVIMSEAVSELVDMRSEAVWVLNTIISGCQLLSHEDCDALREVLRLYLSLSSDHVEAVEGVGVVCRALNHNIEVGLVLSQILVNSQSVEPLHRCLQDIALGQGISVRELLQGNVDHLSKDLNLRMRKLDNLTGSGAGLMRLIRVVMRVPGGGHDVRDLQDTIQSLLLHLAAVEDSSVATVLNIVQVFVGAMKDRMVADSDSNTTRDQPVSQEGFILRIITELEDERKAREKEAEQLLQCPEEGFHDSGVTAEADAEEEEEEKEVESREQEWLRTVVSNTLHFISMSGRADWQVSSLMTVTTCLDLLGSSPGQAPGQRQSVLLPLVHKVWQPLHLCFKSTNIYLVDTAFQCVMTIARHARDFVHSRTVKEIFPPLLQFLNNLQSLVTAPDRRNTLAAAQARRILARLCNGIWDLLDLLDLRPLESDPIIQLVLDHLGTSLTVHDDSAGVFDVVRNKTDGRLRLEDISRKEPLKPKRNVDKNILWLKLNHS